MGCVIFNSARSLKSSVGHPGFVLQTFKLGGRDRMAAQRCPRNDSNIFLTRLQLELGAGLGALGVRAAPAGFVVLPTA